jgi:hypothetical protein
VPPVPPVQIPAPQLWPAAHTVPQAPQFEPSVWVSVHAALQNVPPLGLSEAPPLHVRPPLHVLPHVPQFEGSLCVLVHAVPQKVCPPVPQVHAPKLQI